MTLFLIHCGFYDEEISEGIYEFHVNIPVVAKSIEDAKTKVRLDPVFSKKKMHIDGIQEVNAVSGFKIKMIQDESLVQQTYIQSHLHRDF